MPYQVNIPMPVNYNGNSTYYISIPKHRGTPTQDISVWVVTIDMELLCFTSCYEQGWHNGTHGWGLISDGFNQLSRLGYNLKSPDLLISKFVSNQNQWHGYPADIRHKPADKPLPPVLVDWLEKGLISKALMTRIKQGQL